MRWAGVGGFARERKDKQSKNESETRLKELHVHSTKEREKEAVRKGDSDGPAVCLIKKIESREKVQNSIPSIKHFVP